MSLTPCSRDGMDPDATASGFMHADSASPRARIGQFSRLVSWLPIGPIGQLAANLLSVGAIIGLVSFSAHISSSKNSAYEFADCTGFRPAAFNAEEIFLPRSLLAKAHDHTLREILSARDVARLDAFLDANGLRDAWFLVRYQSIASDGSTWRKSGSNFECKRYHVHSSGMKEVENRLGNLNVLARVLSRSTGAEPDAIVTVGQTDDPTATTTHFDKAKVIPIPDEATGRNHIQQTDLDDWRSRVAQGGG